LHSALGSYMNERQFACKIVFALRPIPRAPLHCRHLSESVGFLLVQKDALVNQNAARIPLYQELTSCWPGSNDRQWPAALPIASGSETEPVSVISTEMPNYCQGRSAGRINPEARDSAQSAFKRAASAASTADASTTPSSRRRLLPASISSDDENTFPFEACT